MRWPRDEGSGAAHVSSVAGVWPTLAGTLAHPDEAEAAQSGGSTGE
jgi:hypothetical protein